MMYGDCEGCPNMDANEYGLPYCERYGCDCDRINYCEDSNKDKEKIKE